ncbi:DEAD-box ATP-dependent RNA helicase, partial [Striga asiatica]
MATVEAPPGMLGPRYAPDDPTLPEPWKGLIDGNTGVMYYWNPETNATQYEKPPPLPSGPPPAAPTPKMNPLPATRSSQPDNIQTPQNQQTVQTQVTQGQLTSSSFQQPVQQGFTQPMQPGQQQAPYQLMQSMPHVPQGQTYPGAQMGSQHGFQFTRQPTQYTVHQRNMPPQGPQSSSQQLPHQERKTEHGQIESNDFHQAKQPGFAQANQNFIQGKQSSYPRDRKSGTPYGDDVEYQQVKHAGLSPAQIQKTGMPPLQNMSSGVNSPHGHKMSIQLNQSVEYSGRHANMQRNNPSIHMPQTGTESTHLHHGSRFQNQMGPGMIHGQQQNLPHPGSKMPYEENHLGRPGNEYFYNTAKDVKAVSPQLPKLSPLPPSARNQQELRMGDFTSQNAPHSIPGRSNGPGGPALSGVVHGNSSGASPYPNNAVVRPPLSIMGPSDPMHLSAAEIYRQKHEVTATGDDVPAPFMTFEATGFPPEILQEVSAISAPKEEHMSYAALRFAGFSAPTPIQAQTWPIALQSRDIVAIAKTGSGKTLGYLMPAFIHLRRLRNNPQNGPTVLLHGMAHYYETVYMFFLIWLRSALTVSFSVPVWRGFEMLQLEELDRGADIVVATPGRLNDILGMKRVDFRQVSFLVLDEADRMLDMGFEPQIRKIVNEIPPRRQTLMYTATWPKEVCKIASDLLINAVQVNIGSVDELAANKSITQYVEVVPVFDKQRRLEQILRSQERGSKIIIFCSTKKLCDHLARNLGRNYGAAAIHGDKSQGERDWVLNQFRSGKSPVLVATDVAARGLDIRDIRVVINYDFPTGIEDYVHRIGRTGRAGATGIAHTFFSEQDWKHAPDLVKLLEGANQAVPPEVRDIAMCGGPTFSRDRGPVNRYDSSADGGHGRGGRWDSGGRRGGRDSGFGGGRGGWERGGRVGPHERFNSLDTRGRGRGQGRGRFDGRDRSRGRSYSSSPERVRTWGGYSRSRSRSRSWSRSRSRSRSWSRSRSRSRSPRSRSRSYERYERRPRVSKFDVMDPNAEVSVPVGVGAGAGRGNGGASGAESAEQGNPTTVTRDSWKASRLAYGGL